MNAEQEEAAEVDRLMAPQLKAIADRGGVLVARKASIDEDDGLVLSYVVMLPLAVNRIKVELCAVKLP